MKEPRHDAEGYRVMCIILVVVIAVICWQLHKSEEYRLKLLDELQDAQARIEELERELK
jgi:hypothetical protein